MSEIQNSKRREWANKIEQWRQSGKSAQAWCKQNQVVYTTFMSWHNRLKNQTTQSQSNESLKTQFIELKEELKTPGIFLEYRGVFIHLSAEFHPAALKKCIDILRGVSC